MQPGELIDIFKTDFLLFNEHNFILNDIDSMIPYEREIYVKILIDHLEKKKEASKAKNPFIG